MLYDAPANTFDVLQRAQNNLARVVCQRGGRTDAEPLLRSLHWLPVKQRVTYKMATLTFKVLSSSRPAYVNDPDPVRCSCSVSAIFRRPGAVCCKNRNWIRTAGILSRSSTHLELTTVWH